MFRRLSSLLIAAMLLAPLSAAYAGQVTSAPISHGAGFSSVACHVVNVGTKPIVIDEFFIKQIVASPSYANDYGGCLGFGPYTIEPGKGCTRRMSNPAICNQPDACYCYAQVDGSSKQLRGTMIGTVSGSTVNVTSELRAK